MKMKVKLLFALLFAAVILVVSGGCSLDSAGGNVGSYENQMVSGESGSGALSQKSWHPSPPPAFHSKLERYSRTVITFYWTFDPRDDRDLAGPDDFGPGEHANTFKPLKVYFSNGTHHTYQVKAKYYYRYVLEGSGFFFPNDPNGSGGTFNGPRWTINLKDDMSNKFDKLPNSVKWGYDSNNGKLDPWGTVAVVKKFGGNFNKKVYIPFFDGAKVRGDGYIFKHNGMFEGYDSSWSFGDDSVSSEYEWTKNWVDIFVGTYDNYLKADAAMMKYKNRHWSGRRDDNNIWRWWVKVKNKNTHKYEKFIVAHAYMKINKKGFSVWKSNFNFDKHDWVRLFQPFPLSYPRKHYMAKKNPPAGKGYWDKKYWRMYSRKKFLKIY